MEELELSLSADDLILHLDNPKGATKNYGTDKGIW